MNSPATIERSNAGLTEEVRKTSSRVIVSPAPGGPMRVAFNDIAEAMRLSPVWLYDGWINVLWRFRRTRLGPFWHTLGMGGFILTVGMIWSTILHQDLLQYLRFMTINMITWTYIACFISEGTSTLISGAGTAMSMRFPYIAFAFAHAWRALLMLAHHSLLYVFVIIATMHFPDWTALLVIPALVLVTANGIWLSLFFGMVCLRWRDLVPATSTAVQVLSLITPVFWPKEMLGPNYAFAADLNPLYHMIRIVREPLVGAVPPLESWLWVTCTLVIGTITTLWIYGRYRYRISYWY